MRFVSIYKYIAMILISSYLNRWWSWKERFLYPIITETIKFSVFLLFFFLCLSLSLSVCFLGQKGFFLVYFFFWVYFGMGGAKGKGKKRTYRWSETMKSNIGNSEWRKNTTIFSAQTLSQTLSQNAIANILLSVSFLFLLFKLQSYETTLHHMTWTMSPFICLFLFYYYYYDIWLIVHYQTQYEIY